MQYSNKVDTTIVTNEKTRIVGLNRIFTFLGSIVVHCMNKQRGTQTRRQHSVKMS